MEDENRLIAERKRKLNEIKELGINPYPSVFKKTHLVSELKEKYSKLKKETHTQDKVKIAGRITQFHNGLACGFYIMKLISLGI